MLKKNRFNLAYLVLAAILPLIFAATANAQPGNPESIEAIAWSPDGSHIATGHTNGNIKIWNATTGQLLHTLQGHSDAVLSINWRSDNEQIISGSWDDTVKIWNASSGQLLTTLSGFSGGVGWVGWKPDSSEVYVFTYTQGKNLHIFDPITYSLLNELEGGSIAYLTWSPDLSKVAVASASGYTAVWDASTFSPESYSPDAEDFGAYGVYTVAWSPDGTLVASGTSDGWVRIWNLPLGAITFALRGTDSQIDDWTISESQLVFFNADGNRLTSLSADGTLRTWDVNTGNILETVQLPTTPIYAAALSPDGTTIAYGGEGGTFSVIPAPSPGLACTPSQTISAGDVAGLISAINTANTNPDADVIGLAAGTYTFTSINNNRNALPRITTDITICSTDGATLTRSPSAPQFRFFEVRSTGNLTLENLTLTNGSLGVDDDGGAIFNLGTLTVNNVTFSNNQAGVGGAIASEDGQITVIDSTFTDNSSTGDGGAIHSEADLLIETSTFTGNSADDAGAVNNDGGNLTVTDSTFTDNSADDGGAIYNDAGTLTLSGSMFTNNAGDAGGALDNLDGQAQIDTSTFTGNTASDGGAIRNYGGTISLTTSAFSGNLATDDGGALNNSGGTLTITDTRLENNIATTRGGAIYSNSSGTMSAHHSCISGNSATAVYAASTGLQDFTGNWWGAADGPDGAGPGSGDTINSKINHASFLTTGCPLP